MIARDRKSVGTIHEGARYGMPSDAEGRVRVV